MPEVGNRWSIGLAGWIVQDGNYDDFCTGQRAEFAVEFYMPDGVQGAAGEPLGAVHLRDDLYEVIARVVHCDRRGWVLDFGIMAFCQGTPPEGIREAATVRAQMTLGVDPFFYFEDLAKDPEWPNLIYTWDIREIWRETAPFIQRGNVFVRDETKLARITIPRTDAWRDDDGNGDYVFVCELVETSRKRSSTTAR